MVITPDDRYIISSSFDKSIKIYDLHGEEETYHFQNAHAGIYIIEFSLKKFRVDQYD